MSQLLTWDQRLSVTSKPQNRQWKYTKYHWESNLGPLSGKPAHYTLAMAAPIAGFSKDIKLKMYWQWLFLQYKNNIDYFWLFLIGGYNQCYNGGFQSNEWICNSNWTESWWRNDCQTVGVPPSSPSVARYEGAAKNLC